MDPGWYPLVRGMNTNVEMLLEFEALIWLSTSYITRIFKEPPTRNTVPHFVSF